MVQVTVDYNLPFDLTLEGVNVTDCKNKPYSSTDHLFVSRAVVCRERSNLYLITYKYIGPTDDVEQVSISINLTPGSGTAFTVKISGMFYI